MTSLQTNLARGHSLTPGVKGNKALLGLDVTKVSSYRDTRRDDNYIFNIIRTNSEGKLPEQARLIVVDRLQDCCLGLSSGPENAL
jgi:hypothetical protein